MRTMILWDWFDFGIMFRLYKNTKNAQHYMTIDIQIAWLNLWILTFKKKNYDK